MVIVMGPRSLAEPEKSDPIISHIPHQNVESTALAAVGYSRRRHILEIKFINGTGIPLPRCLGRCIAS